MRLPVGQRTLIAESKLFRYTIIVMSNPLFNGLHHIAIICSNYEISKRFYVEILDGDIVSEVFRAERNSYKLNILLAGNLEIELFSFPDSPHRLSYPEACGLRHLALKTPDIDAAVRRLTGFGAAVEPVRIDELTGAKFTFFPDPDGLPIELYEVH